MFGVVWNVDVSVPRVSLNPHHVLRSFKIRSPCFLRKVPHGQILHPMPLYWFFGFSDFRKKRTIGMPEDQDFRGCRNCRNPISENPDFPKSENPDFQISGLPNLRKSGFSEIRKSGFSDFRGIGCRIFRGIRCQASDGSGPIKETWWWVMTTQPLKP